MFTTIGFDASLKDGGLWLQKVPTLADLQLGGRWVEIDPRLERRDGRDGDREEGRVRLLRHEPRLGARSRRAVDSVILCGATTSGCIRATAIDLLQYGLPTLVPRECVGDRAQAPHEANLFDIQAKYADVVSLDDALSYVESVPLGGGLGGVTHRVALLPGRRGRPGGDRGGPAGGRRAGPPARWTELPWGSAWYRETAR